MSRYKEVIGEIWDNWNDDNVMKLSAALSYYTAFALAPLLIVFLAVVGLVFHGEEATTQVLDQIRNLLGENAAIAIKVIITNLDKYEGSGIKATLVAIVTVLFGAGGVFAEIQSSLNLIWKIPPQKRSGFRRLLRDRSLSFAMVVGAGFLLLASVMVSTVLSAVTTYGHEALSGKAWEWRIANFIFSFSLVTLLFALLYRILPDGVMLDDQKSKISWKYIWFGAALSSLLFSLGKSLMTLYLTKGTITSVYGAAGSFAVLLVWVYYTANVLYLGAEVTYTLTAFELNRGRNGTEAALLKGVSKS